MRSEDPSGVQQAPARSPTTPRLLSLHQAAAYLGVSGWTVSEWIRGGVLPAVHLPGSRLVRIDRGDLDDLIERGRPQQAPLN